jgi:uncharacterized protein YgiM (DUF1202 family)
MKWNRFLAIPVVLFLLIASGCSLPSGVAAPVATNPPAGAPNATNPPSAVPLDTQVAILVAQTQTVQAAVANTVQATQAAAATNTPQFTFTPSLTPTLTFTLTPSVPTVSVSVNTNCRTGPGDPYSILGVLNVGQSAEVVGRTVYTDNVVVKLSSAGPTCWLWTQYATVTGDTSKLPLVNPPASPTPAGTFIVAYASTQTCASGYGIKFLITNNGSITWESNKVSATNLNSNVTKTSQYDTFPNYNSANCSLISADDNLAPGENGTTSVFGFGSSPAGHNFTATIRLCSQNGLAGICLEKTITFTP